jgi:4-aminobutyrate aminotransferase-like enzyme
MLPEIRTSIPGPASLALAEKLRRYESRNITYLAEDWPVFWERAEGVNVWDADGNRFLDLTSAFGVCGLGHGAAPVREALLRQAGTLLHAMGDVHPTAAKASLCEALSAATFERWDAGTGRVILGNSGFEAIEAALKTSALHSGRIGVLAFHGSYHGLGFGALTATGLPFFRQPFRAQLKDWAAFVPYPTCYRCPMAEKAGFRCEGRDFPNCSTSCLEKIHDEIEHTIRRRDIGCILVEPVQGRGGCWLPPRDFLPMLRALCDAHKLLLIVDEIYTGFHRTGALFAVEHFGVVPDLICLGKGLTSGFPLSACVGRSDVMDAWPPSTGEALHTSTFLGHPAGCAMALASIAEHLRPETGALVHARSTRLKSRLAALDAPAAGNLRGLGLMLGLDLIGPRGEPATALAVAVIKRALRDGLLLLADGPSSNVLAFSPPFTISEEEIDWAAGRIASYLSDSR